jgi:hypothetical protein
MWILWHESCYARTGARIFIMSILYIYVLQYVYTVVNNLWITINANVNENDSQ